MHPILELSFNIYTFFKYKSFSNYEAMVYYITFFYKESGAVICKAHN